MKTPQENIPALAESLGLKELWFKREDLHHFGSHKGRSIPVMMDHYIHKEGKLNFVISSSGNAALSATLYTRDHNKNNPDKKIKLQIFVGTRVNNAKLARLQSLTNESISITQTAKPKQAAFAMEKNGSTHSASSVQAGSPQAGFIFLRQSTDNLALLGYYELAKELDHIPNLKAIFIPTSSGTTAQALAESFQNLTQKPEIHIVQTTAVHPIADSFQNPLCPTFAETNNAPNTSTASAIVDRVAHRKFAVVDAVLKSGGTGWIVNDDEILIAIDLVKKISGIEISPNSALSVAGLTLAIQNGKKWDGVVVCLITGM
ncbi:MAG: hypothetical protein A2821_00355 [Candidatus Magasanikbacteria bacterium RIFCSPHIGHO2_01_FULL_41_23]|uniref:Tryptophan synthase beta chain-like PALP domain-containing protein n=1 Tax=Candidatus Magasanikbacteria bacterium RIFCSPLOWO2_01_FULL_40_15 TaxID=1798686 RepID=A0A1F6N103_9BACT|nr:MAG: hypothetical protein A2821_00355 [Candidatus Magasanikbacteria bacterium RIFCSPHIGHO2_01_FULL_41_23]OGH74630.1 MAG: hypothetical protein A3F22_01710 [Candidatus Magasanikbacteria bacterium RIFCSPHIGHO2_12_FULL_41_16]OGH77343.1 MAG: hypothetical protein A2983_01410 [Candidatus Magasanikbacteria bacterium RIFCSPLOWO2_01_FULL_40_15]